MRTLGCSLSFQHPGYFPSPSFLAVFIWVASSRFFCFFFSGSLLDCLFFLCFLFSGSLLGCLFSLSYSAAYILAVLPFSALTLLFSGFLLGCFLSFPPVTFLVFSFSFSFSISRMYSWLVRTWVHWAVFGCCCLREVLGYSDTQDRSSSYFEQKLHSALETFQPPQS